MHTTGALQQRAKCWQQRHLQHALTSLSLFVATLYHHMQHASHSRAWLTVAALAVVTTQQRAAAMQPSKPLQYCSHDMSSRGIPSLQASVLQSFGKSVSFADDVQVLQTQVHNRHIMMLPVCTLFRIDRLNVSLGSTHCIIDSRTCCMLCLA
jgi:hypothetical protein